MSAQREPSQPNHRILTIDEVAELLNVSPELLQRWALADFGPTVYIVENGFRYRRDEVIEWRDKIGCAISSPRPVEAARQWGRPRPARIPAPWSRRGLWGQGRR